MRIFKTIGDLWVLKKIRKIRKKSLCRLNTKKNLTQSIVIKKKKPSEWNKNKRYKIKNKERSVKEITRKKRNKAKTKRMTGFAID